jgi:hypothetical protein
VRSGRSMLAAGAPARTCSHTPAGGRQPLHNPPLAGKGRILASWTSAPPSQCNRRPNTLRHTDPTRLAPAAAAPQTHQLPPGVAEAEARAAFFCSTAGRSSSASRASWADLAIVTGVQHT